MTKYYINRAEPFAKGLKLELSQEGKNYPIKNVTIWNDHPRYQEFQVGKEVECEIYEKDSGTPNPNKPGSNYVDRTVSKFDTPKKATNTQQMAQNTQQSQYEQANNILLQNINRKVGLMMEHMGIKDTKEEIEKIRNTHSEGTAFDGPIAGTYATDISPEDMPFN